VGRLRAGRARLARALSAGKTPWKGGLNFGVEQPKAQGWPPRVRPPPACPPPPLKVASQALPSAPAVVERRVVVLGFAPFERHQLQTVLRLAGARRVRYELVDDPLSADLAVADGDDAAAVARLQGGRLPVLWVGGSEPASGPRLPRPINVALVVRSLDELAHRGPPPPAPVQRVLDELAQLAGVAPAQPRARVLLALPELPWTRLLLVPLQRAGCELRRVRSGVEAIERARTEAPDLVLIDAALDGLDGYHACRSIKRRAEAEGRTAPPVVLIAAGPAAVNRVRAEMAGADRLLEPPLDGEALLGLLALAPGAAGSAGGRCP